ncbi:MAG: alkaline phosphatase family protein [Desulfobacteraceae bacterium]|nr:MAG: alkaline phosphatase family protein [Desulfobacteraceae bacterium]
MDQKITQPLPNFICGPMLRRLTSDEMVLWWISPQTLSARIHYYLPDRNFTIDPDETSLKVFRVGTRAWVHLAHIRFDDPLPCDQKIEYDIETDQGMQLTRMLPHIVYPGQARPSFVVREKIKRFFHGSCRKPHHDSTDAFTGLDREIRHSLDDMTLRPALLMLTGDQIYADDVAGPMLQAIHSVVRILGLYPESFDDAAVEDSHELYARPDCYYLRKNILPRTKIGEKWYRRGGAKHIFSSSFAQNHMVTFAEWMAMYILVWSPALWDRLSVDPMKIPVKFKAIYEKESLAIEGFVKELPKVQRLLAHIPTYMIFDDHDVTDDWNLTSKWEQRAYGHPFTKRIIGNGLMAYFLCQGLGNSPATFPEDLLTAADRYFTEPEKPNHDRFIDRLLDFRHWHYEVPLFPELVVVDSRTQRWKRDRRPASPSGLLNWEALMKLQHKLMRTQAVLLVAPAPIFGVKIIELIQRFFTMFGYSLAVDAENWMGHRKSAYALLEIFKNARTASHNVIISGDVHYSFAYDVELRFSKNCPGIWQITSSGIKNEFPGSILTWLDTVNQIMYSPWSPLNLFTKRRDMVIHERVPKGREKQRLINACGIGRVTLDDKGAPLEIAEIYADKPPLLFEPQDRES